MFLLLNAVVAVSLVLTAARPESQVTPAGDVDAGRAAYVEWCAPCHGLSATGYGPAAAVLKQPPPDLTRFSRRTVPFPGERLRNHISGRIRLAPSHGHSEMPAWRGYDLDPLLAYLESIQLEKFGPYTGPTRQTLAASGRRLFRTHCVTCHGPDGRGPSPPDYVVAPSMDLTTIARRNGGAFEWRRVYESIAQCDEGSEMPSWRDAFMRAGWGEYLTMKNIENLAAYVEAIQR